jgi:hypothetical protein
MTTERVRSRRLAIAVVLVACCAVPLPGSSPNAPPDLPSNETPADQATGIEADPQLCVDVSDPDSDSLEVTFLGREVAGATSDDFSLVVLPDTQLYSQDHPEIFAAQTQWIVDNKTELGIVFVTHVGDVVQIPVESQWVNANAALARFDPVGDAERIPYGLAVGNHDQPTTNFNRFFGVDRFCPDSTCRGYYGGHHGSTNNNSYQLFSAGGMDFVVIHLEWDPHPTAMFPWPDDGSQTWAVMTWAVEVLRAHSDRRAIISAHFVIDPENLNGGLPPWSVQGERFYNWFRENENVFLMVCGHLWQAARRSDPTRAGDADQDGVCDDAGRGCIHSVVADYQVLPNGGNGWLRVMTFSPNNDTIRVRTFSPTLETYMEACDYSDPEICACSIVGSRWVCGPACDCSTHPDHAAGPTQNDFYLEYEMPDGPALAQIGSSLTDVASGTRVCANWPGRLPGNEYEWYVELSDGDQSRRGPRWTFSSHGRCDVDGDCDDGLVCNGMESCDVGITDLCVPGDDPCLFQSCDGSTGACVPCSENGECDDGDACTMDTCERGLCVNSQLECTDSNACTIDVCIGGTCDHVYAPETGCCTGDSDCYDGDGCSVDRCEGGSCTHELACCHHNTDCDDGDACTQDACFEEEVVTMVDIVGNDVDVDCGPLTALTHDPKSPDPGFTTDMIGWTHTYDLPPGEVVGATLTVDAGDLDDGLLQLRTTDGTLIGSITGGDNGSPGPFVCPWEWDGVGNDVVMEIPPSQLADLADGEFHVQSFVHSGSVDAYGSNRSKLTIELLQSECAHTAIDCDDGNTCTTDSCGPLVGCINEPTADVGRPCDDGFSCTGGDNCNAAGACVPAGPNHSMCTDFNPCTADACNPSEPRSHPLTGCTSTLTPGESCDDGNACTVNDRCRLDIVRDVIGTETESLPPDGPCPPETSLTGVHGAASSWLGFTGATLAWTHSYRALSGPILSATLTLDAGDLDTGQLQLRGTGGIPFATITGGDNGTPGPFVCPWAWDGRPEGNDVDLPIPWSLYPDLMDGEFSIQAVEIGEVGVYACNRSVLQIEFGGGCAGEPLNCDDGDVCNGPEECDPQSGCRLGTEPPDCDDLDACTVDGCDPVGGCTHIPNLIPDLDLDGFCLAEDCDDADPTTYPGAPEINDGRDNQCASPPNSGFGLIDEVSETLGFHHPNDKSWLSWLAQTGAEAYEVLRSDSPDFSRSCVRVTSDWPEWAVTEIPVPGLLFHYLVRPTAPHLGSLGWGALGEERSVLCP